MTSQFSMVPSSLDRRFKVNRKCRFTVNRKAVSTGAGWVCFIENSPMNSGDPSRSGVEFAPSLKFLRLLSLSIQPQTPSKIVLFEGVCHTIHIANEAPHQTDQHVARGMCWFEIIRTLAKACLRRPSGGQRAPALRTPDLWTPALWTPDPSKSHHVTA